MQAFNRLDEAHPHLVEERQSCLLRLSIQRLVSSKNTLSAMPSMFDQISVYPTAQLTHKVNHSELRLSVIEDEGRFAR